MIIALFFWLFFFAIILIELVFGLGTKVYDRLLLAFIIFCLFKIGMEIFL